MDARRSNGRSKSSVLTTDLSGYKKDTFGYTKLLCQSADRTTIFLAHHSALGRNEMTTLMTTLANTRDPAVIFAQVHRRQRELASVIIAKTPRRTRTYATATVEDLLDNEFVIEFFETLHGTGYKLHDSESLDLECQANEKRRAANDAAGIQANTISETRRAADRAAFAVMCPNLTAYERYKSLADPISDLPEAA